MDSCIEHGESSLPAKAGLMTTASAVVHLTSTCGLLMTTSDSVFLDTASKRACGNWTPSLRIRAILASSFLFPFLEITPKVDQRFS
jgi:hypothetical protein